jgi:hypothetical protein
LDIALVLILGDDKVGRDFLHHGLGEDLDVIPPKVLRRVVAGKKTEMTPVSAFKTPETSQGGDTHINC